MTSDQFWCVFLLSGYLGALIFNKAVVLSFTSSSIVILASLIVVLWGTFFIVERHSIYRVLQQKIVDIVKGNTDVPDGWHNIPGYFGKTFITGYGAYCGILWGFFSVVVLWYWR